jgi:hypothetical protein
MKPEHPRAQKSVKLKRYLQSKKEEIIWDPTGEPGSDEAWLSMVRVLTKAAFEVFKEITEAGEIEAVHYESP